MKAKRILDVAGVGDIPPGEARVFELDGASIAVANADGQFHALDNRCTHDDGPLGDGKLRGCAIECPRHGARFDVRTGAVLRMPAAFPVRVYPVRVEGGRILVELEG